MRFFKRVLFGLLLAIPGLGLVAAGGGYLWLGTSLPVTDGTLWLKGPGDAIEILRDGRGVPHIRAQSEGDAYFALGFVHAQDRMWQMALMRLIAEGRLAELGGPRLLPHDRAMRTLGIARLARNGLERLSPPVRAALEAYAAGINAWLTSHGGALPPEFYVAGVRPAPWRAADSLLWGRLMALRLSTNWRRESVRAALTPTLPPEKLAALWLPYPADGPVSVPYPGPRSEGPARVPAARAEAHGLPFAALPGLLPRPVPASASNSWAVSGSRTATAKPIVAGDPHLGLNAPNLWYLARVSYPDLSIAGATLPGVPFHILGHNGSIGWTMTTTGADTQDLVIERLAPGEPGRYLGPAGPRPFLERTETIKVKGAEPLRLTVRATENGPVVSDLAGRDGTPAPDGGVIALRATMLAPEDPTPEALYRLNRARDWQGFRAALSLFHMPVQNFVYGDTAGHIGFQVAGRIPVRAAGDGSAPVSGTDEGSRWTGTIPFDARPSALDPEAGFLVNANNRVAGPGYPHLITLDWDKPYRARRIIEVLAADRRHDAAASARLQMDTLSLAAREAVPMLLAATPKSAATGAALDRLAAWDGHILRDRPEPLILHAWLREAVARITADELRPLSGRPPRWDPQLLRHVLERDPGWCDDSATPAKEDCGTVLGGALETALEDLGRRFGPDMAQWRWGDAHRARLRNLTLSRLPLIGRLADIEIATDGDTFTLNRGTTRGSDGRAPFAHVHGATYRAVYDFADLERSLFMQPGGQSGNPLSPHYRDLTAPWRDGESFTIPARPAGTMRRLILQPVGAPER
jgi:penicillin amidase